uniref:LIM zinc-binding domain-containing protein n=1 Tax=Paramoeba aestuarina TaxID=180227 RepID=A0A7S4L8E0_9EUKA|mmetsp:Transcript_32940/g.51498  ORF Transcript_32940/g.51498 Transcript_32940/m.51498 type:complete len:228 (+) Transcript_32940:57-740(+)
MGFCTNCGNNVGTGKFCGQCGEMVKSGGGGGGGGSSSYSSNKTTTVNKATAGAPTHVSKNFTDAFGLTQAGTTTTHDVQATYTPSQGGCAVCGQLIQGKWLNGDQGKIHPHCHTCGSCDLPLGMQYAEMNGRKLCIPCAQNGGGRSLVKGPWGKNCHGCGKPCEGETVVEYSFKPWHVGCFNCVDCHQPVKGTAYRVGGELEYTVGQEARIVGGRPRCQHCGSDWKR